MNHDPHFLFEEFCLERLRKNIECSINPGRKAMAAHWEMGRGMGLLVDDVFGELFLNIIKEGSYTDPLGASTPRILRNGYVLLAFNFNCVRMRTGAIPYVRSIVTEGKVFLPDSDFYRTMTMAIESLLI